MLFRLIWRINKLKFFPNRENPIHFLLSGMLKDYYNGRVENVSLYDITSWASSDSIWDLTIPLFSQYMMGCTFKGYTKLMMNLTEFGTNLCLKKKILEESSDNETLLCCFNMAQTLVQENYEGFIVLLY